MLYVADLDNGLLKVGITHKRRARDRVAELKREFGERGLQVFLTAPVPYGWGTDRSWERRLLKKLARDAGRLQLFSRQHESTEVVEATREEAHVALNAMLRETEVDPQLSAWELSDEREDWRFEDFIWSEYPDAHYSHGHWLDLITRQVFLYSLRREPTVRAMRQAEGYTCVEIEIIKSNRKKTRDCILKKTRTQ